MPKVKSKKLKSKLPTVQNTSSGQKPTKETKTNKIEQHSLVDLTPEEWKNHWL